MTRIATYCVGMLAALFMLMGASCEETDAELRAVLSANCPAVTKTYAVFAPLAGLASDATVNYINFTKSTLDSICADPENATTLTVVTAATTAMVALRKGIAEAEANGADVGYPVETRQLKSTLSRMQKELDRHGR
jgi:hypothetical protein